MSTGQIVGAVVGGTIGFFIGGGPYGAYQGAMLGAALGGALDPPAGPTMQGPRLSDLSFQTSTYGAPLARVYGTVPIVGNIFWLENNSLKEVVKKKKSGGKGGPSQTTKTYSYFATFAVALCDTTKTGPIAGIRRIWIGSNLVYNAGSDDLETIIASHFAAGGILSGNADFSSTSTKFKLYYGTSDQMPDARMQADIGVDDCPAYRNTAYIVFYDLALEKYGNSLQAAQIKVELMAASATTAATLLEYQTWDDPLSSHISTAAWYLTPEKTTVFVPQWDNSYPPSSTFRKLKFIPGGMRELPQASQPNPISNRPDGESDADITFNDATLGSSVAFSGPSGRFIYRGGIYYGFNASKIWRNDGSGWVSSTIGDTYAIAVDDSGYLYAVKSGAVEKYDSALALVDSMSLAFTGSYSVGQINAHHSGECLFIAIGVSVETIYAIDSNLTAVQISFSLPAIPGANPVSAFRVSGGILTRFCVDNTANKRVHIQQWKIPVAGAALINLSDLVSDEIQIAGIDVSDIDTTLLSAQVRGYRISGGPIRSAIAPLQGAYPFDVIPSGYKIKCVPRGQSSVATIDIGELGAISGNGMVETVLDGPAREMDTQLPKKMVIKYFDPDRDYDINEQSQERIATDSVDIETQELPLVLLADEAANIAQRLLYLRWLERDGFAFTLPITHNNLEPADVVDITTNYGALPLRLTEINYGSDDVLQVNAKANAPAIYTPNAVGGQGAVPSGNIAYAGDSILLLLDIPMMRSDLNEPGFIAAMAGESSVWPGGVAFRSADNGQTFDDVQAFSAPGTFGTARGSLGADSGFVIDRSSTLVCDWIAGTPSSVTEDQILTGYNYFAYGADGRWEIMAVANLSMQLDGSYLCSTFLRGLKGTEFATDLHIAGDYLILLDDPDNAFIGAGYDSFGISKLWRGVTVGKTIDSASDINFTYNGVNLKPLSPVNAVAARDGSNNLSVTFDRRSRYADSYWSSGVQPILGETSESYEIDIIKAGSVVRTITAVSSNFSYSAANQTTDFGSIQSSILMRIYQMSATIGRGYKLETTL